MIKIKVLKNNFPRIIKQSKENLISDKENTTSIVTDNHLNNKDNSSLHKKSKVFLIRKVFKPHENDDMTDDSLEETSKNKRISANSKVNFSKLTEMERNERLDNLTRLGNKLKSKVRKLERKLKCGQSKMISEYINYSSTNKKNKLNFEIQKLCSVINKLKNYEDFDYSDQKNFFESLINMIADEKLNLNSIHFKKICTQVRMFLSKDKINYIGRKGHKISYSFPNQEVSISSKEFDYYSKYNENENIIQKILGLNDKEDQISKNEYYLNQSNFVESTDHNIHQVPSQKNPPKDYSESNNLLGTLNNFSQLYSQFPTNYMQTPYINNNLSNQYLNFLKSSIENPFQNCQNLSNNVNIETLMWCSFLSNLKNF